MDSQQFSRGRRSLLSRAAALATLGASSSIAAPSHARTKYPDRPIRVIVPFPAGGVTDSLARPILHRLGAAIGVPVVIENKPGAGGLIGTAAAARADADGYTLFVGDTSTLTVVPHLYRDPGYVPARDFVPVGGFASIPSVLVTAQVEKFNSLTNAIALARANPGQLTYGSAGPGTSQHVQMELLNLRSGASMLHIPYKGGAPAMQDVLGRRVDFLLEPLLTALPHLRARTLGGLAISTQTRSNLLPDVPTFSEQGIQDFLVSIWFGLFAPSKTPRHMVMALNAALGEALKDSELTKLMREQGIEPMPLGADALGKLLVKDAERSKQIIVAAKISVQ